MLRAISPEMLLETKGLKDIVKIHNEKGGDRRVERKTKDTTLVDGWGSPRGGTGKTHGGTTMRQELTEGSSCYGSQWRSKYRSSPFCPTQAQKHTAFPTPRLSQCYQRFTLRTIPGALTVIVLHILILFHYSGFISFFLFSIWNSDWRKNSPCPKHMPYFPIFRSLLTIDSPYNVQPHHFQPSKSYPSFKPSSTL